MRSDLVFGASAHISNRYQLCGLVSKGARKLHRPKTRLQDTTNDVLALLRQIDSSCTGCTGICSLSRAPLHIRNREAHEVGSLPAGVIATPLILSLAAGIASAGIWLVKDVESHESEARGGLERWRSTNSSDNFLDVALNAIEKNANAV
jgi:hypothetical protein